MTLVMILACVVLACNQGLTPPPPSQVLVTFNPAPEGGNPVGYWVPDEMRAVDASLVDDVDVDTVILDIGLDGLFAFETVERCSINAVMTVNALVRLPGNPPIELRIPTFYDTLSGTGFYNILDDRVLLTPIQSSFFDLDTLGFTASAGKMMLITPAIPFNYMDIMTLDVALIFHLKLEETLAAGAAFPAVSLQVQ